MRRIIVADSSALFSLFIDTDENHKRAKKIKEQYFKQGGLIVIPSEVFAELINILGKKFNHQAAIGSAGVILQSSTLVINTLEVVRDAALKKFEIQPESVSFTDCIVMAFADEYETKEIFGFDQCFKQNGYIRIGIDSKAKSS